MASLTRQAAVISGIFANKAVQQHCLRLLSGTTYKRTIIFHKSAQIYILIYPLVIYSSSKNFIFIPRNTVSILCRIALWNCFRERILATRNFLITNKRSDSVPKQCHDAVGQKLPQSHSQPQKQPRETSMLRSACAWTGVILVGTRRRRATSSFSENVVVAGTRYQTLEVLSFCDRQRA